MKSTDSLIARPARDLWHMPRAIVFLAIVDHGSITAAAKALSVSKGVVSAHLKQLETVCGARLFERTTRRIELTQAGAGLVPFARRMQAAWRDGLDALERATAEPTGTLRITAPIALHHVLLARPIAEYARRFPKVEIVVQLTDMMVDVINAGMDIAIRTGPLPDSGLTARILGRGGEIVVAAPSLLAERVVDHPSQLSDWPWVHHVALPNRRVLTGPGGQAIEVQINKPIVANDTLCLRDLACEGAGCALMSALLAREQLATGTLVRVVPAWAGAGMRVSAVLPSRHHRTPRVQRFVDLLASHAATVLD